MVRPKINVSAEVRIGHGEKVNLWGVYCGDSQQVELFVSDSSGRSMRDFPVDLAKLRPEPGGHRHALRKDNRRFWR